jgi:zinc protease
MHSANVQQMAGYTVLTWYGYAGWGMLDYFVEQPGRYSMAEAFAANEHALVHRLGTCFPELAPLNPKPGEMVRVKEVGDEAKAAGLTAQDGSGLLHDRDVLAFYGDPAWDARMAKGKLAYAQELTESGGVYTLTIRPLLGAKSFDPVNTNGAQRGGRPIVAFLPKRIGKVEVLEGAELKPVITDDFILVPNPGKCEEGKAYVVKFKAG